MEATTFSYNYYISGPIPSYIIVVILTQRLLDLNISPKCTLSFSHNGLFIYVPHTVLLLSMVIICKACTVSCFACAPFTMPWIFQQHRRKHFSEHFVHSSSSCPQSPHTMKNNLSGNKSVLVKRKIAPPVPFITFKQM